MKYIAVLAVFIASPAWAETAVINSLPPASIMRQDLIEWRHALEIQHKVSLDRCRQALFSAAQCEFLMGEDSQ